QVCPAGQRLPPEAQAMEPAGTQLWLAGSQASPALGHQPSGTLALQAPRQVPDTQRSPAFGQNPCGSLVEQGPRQTPLTHCWPSEAHQPLGSLVEQGPRQAPEMQRSPDGQVPPGFEG